MEFLHKNEKSLFRFIGSSFGFLAVAFLSAIVGLFLSLQLTSGDIQNPEVISSLKINFRNIGILMLLLLPYYFCRQALLERLDVDFENKFDYWAKNNGFQPSVLMFISALVITSIVIYQSASEDPEGSWMMLLFGILLSLFPFLVMIYLLISDLIKSKGKDEFSFIERVFIPALATGIIPFSFGWALASETLFIAYLTIASGYVLAIIVISHFFKGNVRLLIPLIVFIIVLFIRGTKDLEIFDSIIYGTLFTAAIGAAETAKRYNLAVRKDRVFVEDNPENYYLGGSNYSSIIFPFLFMIVPLFINSLPAWTVLFFVAIQSVTWTLMKPKQKSGVIGVIYSYIVGYGLPIIIIISNFFNLPSTLITVSGTELGLAFTFSVSIISFGSILFITIFRMGPKLRRFFRRISSYENYLEDEHSYYLFILVLIASIFLVFSMAQFGTHNTLVKQKAIEIIIFCDFLLLLLGIIYSFKFLFAVSDEIGSNGKVASSAKNITLKIKYILITARPFTSSVVGFATYIFLLTDKHVPFWLDFINAIPIMFVTMTGFILNDIYDYSSDKKADLNRPIVNGQISQFDAFKASIFFAVFSIFITIFSFGLGRQLFSILLTLAGVTIYSPFKKKIPISKGFFTSLLTLSPIYYSSTIINKTIPIYIYICVFIFNVGRELLIDVDDLPRDKNSGLKTIPQFLGAEFSRILSWGLMFLAYLPLLLIISAPISKTFLMAGILILCVGLFFEIRYKREHNFLTKIAMLFSILAFPYAL